MRRQARERERHRGVLGLAVNHVEGARALDGGGEVEQLAELPRPHATCRRRSRADRRVQLRGGDRRAGGEQRDVVAARDEPVGQQRRHGLDGARTVGAASRSRPGHLGDTERLVDAARLPHAHAVSSRRGSTRDASKCSRAISPARRAWCGVVAIDALEPVERLLGRREADEAGARGQVRAPARVLHERRPPGRQVALGPVAEPSRPARRRRRAWRRRIRPSSPG